MFRDLAARIAAGAAVVLLSAACTSVTDGSPTAQTDVGPGPTPGPSGDAVGMLQQHWMQFDSDLGDAVLAYKNQHPSPILIKDQPEYDAWQSTLPAKMQPDAEGITLDEQVAVAGYYNKCMEVSSIQNLGDGKIEFDVSIPPEDEGTMCGASPMHVELWIVDLDELGVDDPDDILLKG